MLDKNIPNIEYIETIGDSKEGVINISIDDRKYSISYITEITKDNEVIFHTEFPDSWMHTSIENGEQITQIEIPLVDEDYQEITLENVSNFISDWISLMSEIKSDCIKLNRNYQ